MMRSLFSAVSGLKSHQTRMDVIGNNIANVNTVGFKSSRTTFADTLYQTTAGASAPSGNVGGTNPKQIGLGVGVSSIDTLFTDGSPQTTGNNTDLAMGGDGLFAVQNANGTFYTRDGAFAFDEANNYVLPGTGAKVMGWMADATGSINTGNLPAPISITDTQLSMPPAATTTVTYSGNLNSTVPTITAMRDQNGAALPAGQPVSVVAPTNPPTQGAITSLTLTMSDGSTQTISASQTNPVIQYQTGWSLPIVTTANVYDSLGTLHKIPITFTKRPATPGNPQVADVWSVNRGTATITESDGSTTDVTMNPVNLQFDQNGQYFGGSGTSTLTLRNGAGSGTIQNPSNTMNATVNLSGLTQYALGSTEKADSDGNAAGTNQDISLDSSGTITMTYTNGQRRAIGQVAIARFTNSAGLTRSGGNLYAESNNSGPVQYGTASDLGVTLTPGSLEMSNVDIANEFSDMIVTQRGFQSNSKIITVDDEMLDTVVNMKR